MLGCFGSSDGHGSAAPWRTIGDVTESTGSTAGAPNPMGVLGTEISLHNPKPAVQSYIQPTSNRGNQWPISPAREPDSRSAPAAFASSSDSSPVASRSQVRGSASTTFGGVPRVCLGPEIHWTAAKGGILTSTLAPGATPAR